MQNLLQINTVKDAILHLFSKWFYLGQNKQKKSKNSVMAGQFSFP